MTLVICALGHPALEKQVQQRAEKLAEALTSRLSYVRVSELGAQQSVRSHEDVLNAINPAAE